MPQTLDHDYVTVQQAAAYLQCHPNTIRTYLKTGKLVGSQIVRGGKVRINAASIEKLLERSRH